MAINLMTQMFLLAALFLHKKSFDKDKKTFSETDFFFRADCACKFATLKRSATQFSLI